MRKLLVLLTFLLTPTLSPADSYLRLNCRPDSSNSILQTCTCDLKVKGESNYSGFAQFSCDQLGCEEFESNQMPAECTTGMRGITCWVSHTTFSCPLMIPRAAPSIKTPDICQTAVDDINNLGPNSSYYNYLDYAQCAPAGWSQPAFNGWFFTGSFEDGWN